MTTILDHITTIDFVPHTNLKGQGIGANWVFLLPRLDLKRVVCIGAPPEDMLPALELVSDELICTRPIIHGNVTVQSIDQIPAASVDLIYIRDRHAVTPVKLQRILKPDGLMYYEYYGRDRTGFATSESTVSRFWLTPTLGNVQTAVCLDYVRSRDFLFSRQLNTSTIRHQTLERVGKRLLGKSMPVSVPQEEIASTQQSPSRSLKRTLHASLRRARANLIQVGTRAEQTLIRNPIISRWMQRNGAIVQNGRKAVGELPDYLQFGAQQCGIDIRQWEWAFVARGDYPSQKLLFYLFEPNAKKPSIVAKMVRDAQYNERLEREYRGLKHLDSLGFIHQNTIPGVIFQGYHRELFFLGESVLDGQPFAQKSSLDSDCRYARFVMQWMNDLGVATRTEAAGSAIAALLEPLYQRFIQVYTPDLAQQQFLKGQLDQLGRADTIPLVLRHGDPGLQNLLILPDDTVAFLDWENAELEGISLWDVFYFLSAYCMKVGQVKESVSNLEAYEHYFLGESSLRSFVLDSINRYCETLRLDHKSIMPLYYMFWMYRALKQSTLTNPAHLQDALTWQVLQRSIARYDSLILRSFA